MFWNKRKVLSQQALTSSIQFVENFVEEVCYHRTQSLGGVKSPEEWSTPRLRKNLNSIQVLYLICSEAMAEYMGNKYGKKSFDERAYLMSAHIRFLRNKLADISNLSAQIEPIVGPEFYSENNISITSADQIMNVAQEFKFNNILVEGLDSYDAIGKSVAGLAAMKACANAFLESAVLILEKEMPAKDSALAAAGSSLELFAALLEASRSAIGEPKPGNVR